MNDAWTATHALRVRRIVERRCLQTITISLHIQSFRFLTAAVNGEGGYVWLNYTIGFGGIWVIGIAGMIYLWRTEKHMAALRREERLRERSPRSLFDAARSS